MLAFLAKLCRIGLEDDDFFTREESQLPKQIIIPHSNSIPRENFHQKVSEPKPLTPSFDSDLLSIVYPCSNEKRKSSDSESTSTLAEISYEQRSTTEIIQQTKNISSQSQMKPKRYRRKYKKKKIDTEKNNIRMFGHYWCEYCNREWSSGHSWSGYYQNCTNCGNCVLPHDLTDLKFQGEIQYQNPHISSLCERCKLVGDCRNKRRIDVYKYK